MTDERNYWFIRTPKRPWQARAEVPIEGTFPHTGEVPFTPRGVTSPSHSYPTVAAM